MPTDLSLLLLPQWQNSPRVRALVDRALTPLADDLHKGIDDIERMLDLDEAEGVWLDWLGERDGLPRPFTSDPTSDLRWGFDDAGVPFDQAPFRGESVNDAVYPLADEPYRRLIRARRILTTSDGTVAAMQEAVRELDPAATVIDQRDMTLRVVTDQRVFIEAADTADALPRNGGVALVYADRQRWGFDESGVPFDQGPFAGN